VTLAPPFAGGKLDPVDQAPEHIGGLGAYMAFLTVDYLNVSGGAAAPNIISHLSI
jgi:hypothetical protein